MKYNYAKLMSKQPTSYGTMTNSLGQKIEFFEHPTYGDESFVIVAFPELEQAFDSDFFETDDMENSEDYEPKLIDGVLFYGDMEADV